MSSVNRKNTSFTDGNANDGQQNSVDVAEAYGEWFVRVVENDHETVRSFVRESYALSYAEGQLHRLGLDKAGR